MVLNFHSWTILNSFAMCKFHNFRKFTIEPMGIFFEVPYIKLCGNYNFAVLGFRGLWVKLFYGWLGEDPSGTLRLRKNVTLFKMTAKDVDYLHGFGHFLFGLGATGKFYGPPHFQSGSLDLECAFSHVFFLSKLCQHHQTKTHFFWSFFPNFVRLLHP